MSMKIAEHENCEYIGRKILNCQLKKKSFVLQLNLLCLTRNFGVVLVLEDLGQS